jgi:zinc protease
VFSTILQLNSSKWQQALINSGLATYSFAGYQTAKYTGPINIYLLPNPNKLKDCYSEVMNQVNMWGNDDYFTDEQLQDAKASLIRDEIRRKEKPSSLANELSFHWCSTSLNYFTDYYKSMQNITRDDINNYIKKYIKGKPYVAGIIINPEMNKQSQASTFFKPTI